MAFPSSSAQQQAETNRKILEDIQLKKQQLLQKGPAPIAGGSIIVPNSINQQMPTTQLHCHPTDFQQPNASNAPSATRSAHNSTISTALGFFIPQNSHFGNSFIPVLPRLEPLPPAPNTHNPPK